MSELSHHQPVGFQRPLKKVKPPKTNNNREIPFTCHHVFDWSGADQITYYIHSWKFSSRSTPNVFKRLDAWLKIFALDFHQNEPIGKRDRSEWSGVEVQSGGLWHTGGTTHLKWYPLPFVTGLPERGLWCSLALTDWARWRWWLEAQIRGAFLRILVAEAALRVFGSSSVSGRREEKRSEPGCHPPAEPSSLASDTDKLKCFLK